MGHLRAGSATVIVSAAIMSIAQPVLADIVLPAGEGKEIVESACTDCHGLERIVRQALTAEQWRSNVREMVENGAALNPEEWEPVIQYLAKNFGPGRRAKVDVNKATAKEIAAGLQFSAAEAEAVVQYRSVNGRFRDLKDLQKVKGLDAKKLESKIDLIAF